MQKLVPVKRVVLKSCKWYFILELSLREKRPNTELFLVRIFCIRIEYGDLLHKFNPNAGKYGPEIIPYLSAFHAVFVKFYYRFATSKAELNI